MSKKLQDLPFHRGKASRRVTSCLSLSHLPFALGSFSTETSNWATKLFPPLGWSLRFWVAVKQQILAWWLSAHDSVQIPLCLNSLPSNKFCSQTLILPLSPFIQHSHPLCFSPVPTPAMRCALSSCLDGAGLGRSPPSHLTSIPLASLGIFHPLLSSLEE